MLDTTIMLFYTIAPILKADRFLARPIFSITLSLEFNFAHLSSMASSSAPSSSGAVSQNSKKPLGLIANVKKHKNSFVQFLAMTGILLLSVRSLGQKYRIHDLQEDTTALKKERDSLTERMKSIKLALHREASLDSTGLFASRLRVLFGDEN